MTDNREILNEAEVDFLLANAEEEGNEPLSLEDGNQTVTMHGDLDQISLADIFQTLAMSKMRGVLRVRNPLEERLIYCEDGYVRIEVPQRLVLRRLGQRLIQAGLLHADQLRSALVEQKKARIPLGELLVRDGIIQQQDLDDILEMQVAEDLFAVFTWKHGQFEFFKCNEAGDGLRNNFASCPDYEVNSLLLEVARRSDEWECILDEIGSLDEVPTQIAEPANPDELDDSYHDVLAGIDGAHTYRQLAAHTTIGLFEFARAARDLVAGGIVQNLDDPGLVQRATEAATEGEHKLALLMLQTLQDRDGERTLGIVRGMAEVLEQIGEKRFASSLLLEAAQRTNDPEQSLDLGRKAYALVPYDPGTLSFLRTVLVAHSEPSSEELEKVTADLLDALIDADLIPTALEIVEDVRRTDTMTPQILTREARARQRAKDVDGAVTCLTELAEHYLSIGNRDKAIESYKGILRADRSRRDIEKLIKQMQRTRLDRIVRILAALLVVALIGASGFVWWQQHALETSLREAGQEISTLLEQGDRTQARARWSHWQRVLGDCEAITDLGSQVTFAEAAERKRLEKLQRTRINELLATAAEALGRGELLLALETYDEVHRERGMANEVRDVLTTRIDALLEQLQRACKEVAGRMPPDPDQVYDRSQLTTNLADLQKICPPALLQSAEQLGAAIADGKWPAYLEEDTLATAREVLAAIAPTVDAVQAAVAAYTKALENNETQRRLDPMFKAAVERETKYDFQGALEFYRELERQQTGDAELRAHFRDCVTRNATIVRLLEALSLATREGDFGGAQQQLRALRKSFPKIPFDRLVRVPLTVKSEPEGAIVTINGKEIGKSPLRVSRIPADEIEIVVASEGFLPIRHQVSGDGEPSWTAFLTKATVATFQHENLIESPPAALPDGAQVFVDRNGNVFRLSASFDRVDWQHATKDLSGFLSAPLVHGDIALVSSLDGSLRAFRTGDGEIAWQLDDLPSDVQPALVKGYLVLATTDRRLHLLDLDDRKLRHADLEQEATGSLLAIGSRVICAGRRGLLTCWSLPELTTVWQRQLPDLANPGLAAADSCIVASDDLGQVYGVDPATGEIRWQQQVASPLGKPAVGDRTVYVATPEKVVRLDATTGKPLEPIGRGQHPFAGPPFVVGTRLIVPLHQGSLQVLDGATGKRVYRLAGDKRHALLRQGQRVLVVSPQHELRDYGELR